MLLFNYATSSSRKKNKLVESCVKTTIRTDVEGWAGHGSTWAMGVQVIFLAQCYTPVLVLSL